MAAPRPHEDLKRIRTRASRAFAAKASFDTNLSDVYEYILPFRKPLATVGAQGERRHRRAYDGTAIKSAFRFASRMQQDLTPPFQPWFRLAPGPLVTGADREQLAAALDDITDVLTALFAKGRFHTASHEMYMDLVAGTGAMLVLRGTPENPIRFVAVPSAEIALEEDGDGGVRGVHWGRQFDAQDLPDLWPEGAFGPQLKRRIKEAQRTGAADLVRIVQSTVRTNDGWLHLVDGGDTDAAPIASETFRTNPWITPRLLKVPGETYGRGPAHLAAPTVGSLNKAMEFHLRAAGLALVGVWTRTSDLAFNPDMARLAPGQTIPVARNGGPLGKSLEKLDLPGDFDLSSFVLADLREGVRDLMFDQALPPDAGAVRSATEIVEKMKRLGQDLFGAYGRLALEIVEPLVVRVLDLAEEWNMLPDRVTVDRLWVKLDVTSPMAQAQNVEAVQRTVDWLTMLLQLFGPQGVSLAAKVEDIGDWLGERLGVPQALRRTAAEREQLQTQAAQLAAAGAGEAMAPAGGDPLGAMP